MKLKKKIKTGIFLIAFALLFLPMISATWWNSDWANRKEITIYGGNAVLTNFTALMNVSYASGKMNADFSDIRFIDGACSGTQTQELIYYPISMTNSNSALFRVKIPTLNINSSGATICMYYNKPTATSTKDGVNIFDNLVVYYPFEEGSGTNIASTTGVDNCTLTADTGWINSGSVGKAYNFAGNIEADCGSSTNIDNAFGGNLVGQNWTWLFHTDAIGESGLADFVLLKGDSNPFFAVYYSEFALYLSLSNQAYYMEENFGSQPDGWKMFAITQAGIKRAGTKGYMNGSLMSSTSISDNLNGDITNTASSLKINAKPFSARFNGKFDEFIATSGIWTNERVRREYDNFNLTKNSFGTEEENQPAISPIINITNCAKLQNISNNLTLSFNLINNIDCSDTINWNSGEGFIPIGNSTDKFSGNFDGQGYNITNLFINRSANDYQGLFGYTQNSKIKNVGIINIYVAGNTYDGGLIGRGTNIIVENSYSTGNIYGIGAIGGSVGGLIGRGANLTINNSYSTGNVTSSGNSVGGLIGITLSNSITENCYATGNVTSSGNNVGGLIGSDSVGGKISNSYSTGKVINNTGTNGGGLVGLKTDTENCTNSYWNKYLSGQSTSACGTELNNTEMITQSSYVNWDFTNIWNIQTNSTPYLRFNPVPFFPNFPSEVVSISSVSYETPITLNGGTTKDIYIAFNISSANINSSSAQINITHILSSTTFCYQESANVSTSCGGLDTGIYSFTDGWQNPKNIIDGDWNTYGLGSLDNVVNLSINYSKPVNSISALWQYKSRNDPATNITIPSSCFDYYTDVVDLMVQAECIGGFCPDKMKFYCRNSSGLSLIKTSSVGFWLYEEAMIWGISSNITESHISNSCTNSSTLFNCTITLQFYDSAGIWNINASIKDIEGKTIENSTETFTINALDFVTQDVKSVKWATLNPNTNDNQASNTIILTNGGNQDYATMNIKGQNATGQVYNNIINADKFSVDNVASATTGQIYMISNTDVDVSAKLTLNTHSASSTEEIFFYADIPTIRADNYLTSSSWTIALT